MRWASKRSLEIIGAFVVIVVASVVLIYHPQSCGLNCPAYGAPLVNVFGTITVTTESGAGIMNLTVHDSANAPFTSIEVPGISPTIAGVANDVLFTFDGAPVSSANPLPLGYSANGVYEFASGGISGTSHTVRISVLTNGNVLTGNATLVARQP